MLLSEVKPDIGKIGEERRDGPTPNGGVYSIAYFLDAERRLVPKEEAATVEICEFDKNDECIYRTYMKRKSDAP